MMLGKHILRLLVLCALAMQFTPTSLKAQDTIGFAPSGISGWPDTAFAGDSIPIAAYIKNYSDSSVFSDSLAIEGYVDTGLVVNFTIPYYQLYQFFSLLPGDSSLFIIPIDFRTGNQGGRFHIGNNVVVVWPVSHGANSSFITRDSITLNVFLIDTLSSIGPEYDLGQVRMYPVPSSGPLYINSANSNLRIESVIIRDAQGKIVHTSSGPDPVINTELWSPGIYTVETHLSNGSISQYKIMRQ
jgi:hypothetical protein